MGEGVEGGVGNKEERAQRWLVQTPDHRRDGGRCSAASPPCASSQHLPSSAHLGRHVPVSAGNLSPPRT